jgi:hypothetical protein
MAFCLNVGTWTLHLLGKKEKEKEKGEKRKEAKREIDDSTRSEAVFVVRIGHFRPNSLACRRHQSFIHSSFIPCSSHCPGTLLVKEHFALSFL